MEKFSNALNLFTNFFERKRDFVENQNDANLRKFNLISKYE